MSGLLGRRRALSVMGGAGLLLAGCGSGGSVELSGDVPGSIPAEPPGPFPADGSNGPNVLTQKGIVRKDIRSSFGSSRTMPHGVAMIIRLTLVKISENKPLDGAAIYVWHADPLGKYSMYSAGEENENFCRGVHKVDGNGTIDFRSVWPGCDGTRWPHVNFAIYGSEKSATKAGPKLRTSQMALPADACAKVYESSDYPGSKANFANVSLEKDPVFSDGYALELGRAIGDPSSGYIVSLRVPV